MHRGVTDFFSRSQFVPNSIVKWLSKDILEKSLKKVAGYVLILDNRPSKPTVCVMQFNNSTIERVSMGQFHSVEHVTQGDFERQAAS